MLLSAIRKDLPLALQEFDRQAKLQLGAPDRLFEEWGCDFWQGLSECLAYWLKDSNRVIDCSDWIFPDDRDFDFGALLLLVAKQQDIELSTEEYYSDDVSVDLFQAPINIQVTVENITKFSGAVFSARTNFRLLSFMRRASFAGAKFLHEARFDKAYFQGDLQFMNAFFEGKAHFYEACFDGKANFIESVFQGRANFSRVAFNKSVSFESCEFAAGASFALSKFDSPSSVFNKSKFLKSAFFRETEFLHELDFREAEFSQRASFYGASFAGKTLFDSTNFLGEVHFMTASFAGETSFTITKFWGEASFWGAEVLQELSFAETTFAKNVFLNNISTDTDNAEDSRIKLIALRMHEKLWLANDEGVLTPQVEFLNNYFNQRQIIIRNYDMSTVHIETGDYGGFVLENCKWPIRKIERLGRGLWPLKVRARRLQEDPEDYLDTSTMSRWECFKKSFCFGSEILSPDIARQEKEKYTSLKVAAEAGGDSQIASEFHFWQLYYACREDFTMANWFYYHMCRYGLDWFWPALWWCLLCSIGAMLYLLLGIGWQPAFSLSIKAATFDFSPFSTLDKYKVLGWLYFLAPFGYFIQKTMSFFLLYEFGQAIRRQVKM